MPNPMSEYPRENYPIEGPKTILIPKTLADNNIAVALALEAAGIAHVTIKYNLDRTPVSLYEAGQLFVDITAETKTDIETWTNTTDYVNRRLYTDSSPLEQADEKKRKTIISEAISRIEKLKANGNLPPYDPNEPINDTEKIQRQIVLVEKQLAAARENEFEIRLREDSRRNIAGSEIGQLTYQRNNLTRQLEAIKRMEDLGIDY